MTLDLTDGSIRTILWATGFRPDYSWLHVDVLDHKGRVRHDGGVTTSPGMYLIGMPFLRRRKSSFIHGAGDDAADLAEHLANYLGRAPVSYALDADVTEQLDLATKRKALPDVFLGEGQWRGRWNSTSPMFWIAS